MGKPEGLSLEDQVSFLYARIDSLEEILCMLIPGLSIDMLELPGKKIDERIVDKATKDVMKAKLKEHKDAYDADKTKG